MDTRRYEQQILQDTFWRERIFGFRELSEEKIRTRMECLNLHLEGPYFCVVLFAPYLMEKEAAEIDKTLLKLQSSVQERYKKAGLSCYTISDTYCNVVSIVSMTSEAEYSRLGKITQRVANELIKSYDVRMYAGIGALVENIALLNRSKDSAAEALAYKFTFSEEYVVTAKDVKRYYHQHDVDLKMHYDRVMGCFYDGNGELLETRLNNLFAAVTANSTDTLDSIRNVCIELTATLLRVVRDMGVSGLPEMNGIYTYIAQMESVTQIREWFLGYCFGMMQKVGEARKDKTQQILDQAEKYIEDNLRDPNLTLQSVSDYVGLSAPYFSNIFFKTKGIHINEYINRIRVRYAQKYLLETGDKITNIASSLGFSSPSYFNNVFKRYTGVTPNRFRSRR